MDTKCRCRICPADRVRSDAPYVHPLRPDARGTPREAILVRDAAGRPHAYLNRCCHIPIPLDLGSRDLLDRDSGQLRCLTHGALYRLEDGLCTHGPCRGEILTALACAEDDGWLWLADE